MVRRENPEVVLRRTLTPAHFPGGAGPEIPYPQRSLTLGEEERRLLTQLRQTPSAEPGGEGEGPHGAADQPGALAVRRRMALEPTAG